MFISSVAQADFLTGGVAMTTSAYIDFGGQVGHYYVTPMRVTNITTEQKDFLLFCGDYTTTTSSAFSSSKGQEYNAFALMSPSVDLYTDIQKSRINDLFGHAYANAFDLDGNILNAAYAQAIQLAIWTILHEETDNYNILEGSFHLTGSYNTEVANVTNKLLDAVFGATDWSGIGEFFDYDLTVYIAEGGKSISQTLISVTGSPNREEYAGAVPEPATILMLGMGLAGLGLARRMKK